jgi:hypothetical protein
LLASGGDLAENSLRGRENMIERIACCVGLAAALFAAACGDDGGPAAGDDGGADAGEDAGGDTDSETDTAVGEDGFPMDPADFAEACAPEIVFQNLTADWNGQIFDDAITDPVAFMLEISAGVCALLYREPDEVPSKTQITLVVDDFDGVAGTGNAGTTATIQLSSSYLADYADGGGDVVAEIWGVMFHEVTHVFQRSEDYTTNWPSIEGVADAVRTYAGYIGLAERAPGGSWTDGYKVTAFFFVWLEETYIWFLYQLNWSYDPTDDLPWSWDAIEAITGHPVEELWDEYQEEIS